MTAPTRTRRPFDWEAAGEELGDTLGSYHMIVVAGTDSVTTGRVPCGIARMQSMNRRVAVGDLFAESPPIRELIQTDDPHGIVDSFLYGVSLSRIAYPVPGPGELFAMQSGTEPPDYEEILPNRRWHRLVWRISRGRRAARARGSRERTAYRESRRRGRRRCPRRRTRCLRRFPIRA